MKRAVLFLFAAILFISIPMNAFAGQAYAKRQFSDVKETDWFYPAVSRLVEKGHISGYTDGTFKPQNNIRVSEFTKILISAIGYNIISQTGSYWAEGYIYIARDLGIIQDGEFDNYESYITRGEMARMILRAGTGANAEGKSFRLDIPENYRQYASLITDYSTLDSDSQEIALKIFTSGIITGFPDGSFGFDKNATRAEASTILVRFLEKNQRRIPKLSEESNSENDTENHDGSGETGVTENNRDFAKIILDDDGDSNITKTLTFKGGVSYEYPYMGREHIFGPENTVYYAIYYGENYEVTYGEIIRQADDFVLERVYPDGTYDTFTPPPLTEKQKQDFFDKYNPAKRKEKEAESQRKAIEDYQEAYKKLIEEGIVIPVKGDNYVIDMYTKPDEEVMRRIVGTREIKYGDKEVNYGNTVEKDFDFDVKTVRDSIIPILDNADLTVQLRVSIVPYQCEDFPQGVMGRAKAEEGMHIVLFNDKTPMKKQFEIQFKEYLKYLQEIKNEEY